MASRHRPIDKAAHRILLLLPARMHWSKLLKGHLVGWIVIQVVLLRVQLRIRQRLRRLPEVCLRRLRRRLRHSRLPERRGLHDAVRRSTLVHLRVRHRRSVRRLKHSGGSSVKILPRLHLVHCVELGVC